MTLPEFASSLHLPDLLENTQNAADWSARRRELLRLLEQYDYGVTPPAVPAVGEEGKRDDGFCAGKGESWETVVSFDTPKGRFSFPVFVGMPKAGRPCPTIVFLNFRPDVPDKYLPAEELIDRGYGFARIYYQDVTSDDADLTNGLAGMFGLAGRGPDGMGKIGCWAYAASRCLDYLLTIPEVDPARVAVCGHSRLGKTALWCGAQDERFAAVFGNNAGAGGDAVYRGKRGEQIADLVRVFPYWFCPRLAEYAGREADFPLDQHFLLAAAAPRPVAVVGAEEDIWADPVAQLISCAAASDAYRLLGKKGIVLPEELPAPGTALIGDGVGFLHRPHRHALCRTDWNFYLDFWEAQRDR